MMKSNSFCGYSLIITFFMLFLGARSTSQLTPNFYGKTCPNLFTVVKNEVQKAFDKENRMAASLLQLHFHDCFVNVRRIPLPTITQLEGFEVVDIIKGAVERECPGVTRGPSWTVLLGRRDGFVSSRTAADDGLPSAFESLENITKKYAKVGLNIIDVVSSSGSHTIGLARIKMGNISSPSGSRTGEIQRNCKRVN
uniref:peroxidase n=1 Tax=Fagus sylvatica TaxID=28930 RepID=A0A2N9IP04_FAGSY